MASSYREDAAARLASLRAQVDQLMHERVSPAMASATETAASAMQDAAATVKQRAETVSGHVRAHPLLALAGAMCVGFIAGRLLR